MAKLTLTQITSGYNAATQINGNMEAIEDAIENSLSRDGTAPNQMAANFDMNSYRIINLPDAVNDGEPVTLRQAGEILGIGALATQAQIGAILYPRTSAEIAAGVTPVDYSIPSHDSTGDVYIERYLTSGLDTSSSANAATVTTAIRNAIKVAAQAGAELRPRSKTYLFAPAELTTDEAGTLLRAFELLSGLHICAQRDSVFKLADSQSTDGAPKALACFHTNQVLSGVSIRHLEIDMNGANNSISPSRPTTYNQYNQSHISVSGTPSGVAARIDDMVIDDCVLRNTAGVCCIVVAQSNTASVTLGNRWRITNNKFLNNGLDTDDHTSIFAWANDVICSGNVFSNDTPPFTTGKTGGRVAYEVHGSNHKFTGNNVKNYLRGVWVSSNYTSVVENTLIQGNTFYTSFYGIDFFRTLSSLTTHRNTLISGNSFYFDSYNYTGAPTQKAAVNIACEYAISNVRITDNVCYCTDTVVGSAFCVISPQTVAGQTYDKIVCNDNQVFGTTYGVFARTNATNGLGYIEVKNNTWTDLSNAGVFTSPIGVFIDGVTAITTLHIDGNACIDTRSGSAQCDYGVYATGTVTNYYLGRNTSVGMVSSDYLENSFTATNRRGINGFSTLAAASTLTIPAEVTNLVVTGNTNIDNIATGNHMGKTIGITFTGTPTVSDGGGNLKLAGNFVASADDSLVLWCDGTSWFERSRSAN